MPDIIEINDSDAVVRSKIIAILEFDGISTDDITSWGIATNRLNLAANRLGFNNITNNMPGSEARAIINQLAVSPAPVYPENTVLPTISGNARYNQTLTATTGTWNGYPAPTYSYQWQADEIPIPGATSSTYLIKESDLGKQIRVGVTATNLSGPASVFSNPTAVVTSTPINSSLPTISGTAANGQTLTANNGTWISFPVPTFTYQWKADGVDIAGATNQTLALGNNQIGREITVSVNATNSEGFDTKTTNATARVTSAPINTVLPLVAAEIVEGKAVTTTSGAWLGYPVQTYAYQWKRNENNISGATSSSYTPVSADVGQNITVTVTATNSISAVQATSVAKMAKPAWAETFDVWADFTKNFGSYPELTDTHISSILANDSDGLYSSFAPNVLVRTNLGIQTVPTRTNVVTNNTMVGATVGNPGTLPAGWSVTSTNGLSRECIEIGIENGLPYIDFRIFGTGISNNPYVFALGPTNMATTAAGQIWSASYGLKILSVADGFIAPSFCGVRINETMVGGGNLSGQDLSGNIPAIGVFQRYERQVTMQENSATARMSMRFTTSLGANYDFVVRYYAPQFELGSYASQYILTDGTSSTVNGNRVQMLNLGTNLVNGVIGIIKLDFKANEPISQFNMVFSDGTVQNRYGIFSSSGNVYQEVHALNGTSNTRTIQPANVGNSTFVFGVANNYRRIRMVGGADIGVSTAYALPSLSRLAIGGLGYTSNNSSWQYSKNLTLHFLSNLDDPNTVFNNAYEKALLLT